MGYDAPTRCKPLRYDLAIIGRGMIGSAAARHAAKLSRSRGTHNDVRIVLIGPSEQSSASSSMFGAHYDEGRITRRTDPDPIWAELASRSITRYDEIFRESGGPHNKHFYSECGHLVVGQDNGNVIKKRRQVAKAMGINIDCLDADALREKFPCLHFPGDCVGLHEKEHAGYISARGLVEAQTTAAQKLGVHIIDDVAQSVERCILRESNDGDDEYFFRIVIGYSDQRIIEADKVLVAAGAFCNSRPLLPTKLKMTPIKTQTVHFVLTEDDAIRLKDDNMPSIIVKNDELWAYILPPIRYPDGTVCLKLGGAYLEPDGKEYGLVNREIHSHKELVHWYRSNGSKNVRRDMEHMLRSFVPNTSPLSIVSNSCATLNTPTGQAYIGEVEDGWAVATGGNGLAAKSSDELGRLAATCILDRETFQQESICGKNVTEVFCPMPDDEVSDNSMAITTKASQESWRTRRKRDIAKDVTVQIVKELTTKREAGVLPRAVAELVQRIESNGEIIERMVVVRTPVQAYVGQLMQIVSFGKYRDVIAASSYDNMFHLSLLINGRYVLQKNEVIALTDAGSSKCIEKGSDVMAVKIPTNNSSAGFLTFTLLLDRTREYMGPDAFSNYCAKKNNCQDFILAVLESNGLAYSHLISFIKQDSEEIFNKLPGHTKPVARALTDVAAVGNKVAENVSVKQQETIKAARDAVLGRVGGLSKSVTRKLNKPG